jgi:hypothetical protein
MKASILEKSHRLFEVRPAEGVWGGYLEFAKIVSVSIEKVINLKPSPFHAAYLHSW